MNVIIPVLFYLLFVYCIGALIIGLIKPTTVMRWGKTETRNRLKVLKVYGLGSIFALLLGVISIVVTAPSTDGPDNKTASTADSKQSIDENTDELKANEEKAKEEKVKEKIAAENKAAADKASAKKAAYEKKLQNEICQDLISKGIEEKVAIKALNIYEKYDLPVWNSKDAIQVENASKDDFIYSYSASDGAVSVVFAVHVLKGDIVEIVDENQEVVYNTKGLNKNYMFYKDCNLDTAIDYSKEVVNSVLKSPSTAEYPGSWLSPYEGWAVAKKKNVLTLSSYVDSQNSFGATVRSKFVFKFKYSDGGKVTPVYFAFDGKVLVNKQ
jgi:hypothetical protein